MRWTRKRLGLVAAGVGLVIALLAAAALALAGSADVVVYNGRSQYGDEQAFKAFEEQTGLDVELRGGTAPELFERLRREGDRTDADVLVTTDLANLWRAEEAGLLEPVETRAAARAGAGRSCAIPAARGGASAPGSARRCARPSGCRRAPSARTRTSGTSASRAACACGPRTTSTTSRSSPTGSPSTARPRPRRCCARGWPTTRRSSARTSTCSTRSPPAAATSGSPTTTTSAASSKDDPDFPVAPAWPDAGAHLNLSGAGVVKGSEHRRDGDPAARVPHGARGAGRDRRERRVRRQPRRAARRAPARVGGRAHRPDRRRARRAVARGRRRADAARGVGVAVRRRPSGWTVAGIAVAAAVLAPLLVLPGSFVGQDRALDQIGADLLPEALRASLVLAAGRGSGDARARGRPRRARLLLRLPGPALARLGAGAAAGDAGLRARLRAAGAVRRVRSVRRAPAGGAVDRRGDRGAHARALPVRVRARPRRVPRPVAPGARGGPHARPLLRRGGPAGGDPARAPGAGRRRGARGDGGAGGLRRRQPAQLPRAHRRDLPRLVRDVRPGGGAAAGHRAGDAGGRARRARALRPRARALRPGPVARRGGDPAAPARARRVARGRRCRRCCWRRWWSPRWCSCSRGRSGRSGRERRRRRWRAPRSTACCSRRWPPSSA